ncbi:MAG: CocE/NonD family hydrolase [Candidatus Limnocylindrales bacterium]
MTDTDPRPASPPSHEIAVDWDVRIPARDGVELSANIWRPVPRPGAPDERFPAILEMIPYGKDNWRRASDMTRGEWFAARGFALCRVDVRGTGSSDGVALDEYTADETRDGFDVVEWLAARPWCTGSVGMWGISYGGFTAIQVAALRPPHLRAIVPVMATDDRYLDDIHYRGGCVTVSELSQYAVSQVAMNAMPPEASFRGAAWRDEWRARLDATPPWLFAWLGHQTDGPYWRQGSLTPDYDAIEAAIFNIGGWQDSYVDPAFRMQARCTAPSHTLIGNWVHSWPHDASPGPNLDELHEIARFFDRHLRGIDNGWEAEPPIVWFEHEFAPPEPFPASLPGRWRAAVAYPHPATSVRTWRFGAGTLNGDDAATEAGGVDVFSHRPTTGTRGPLSWGAGGAPNGLARDLRRDEDAGPTYTSAPLGAALEVLGVPEVVVNVEVDAPVATLSVRLSDVAPDGTVALVSAGVLNLTHRRSHVSPDAMVPGAVEEVRVPLRTAGYRWGRHRRRGRADLPDDAARPALAGRRGGRRPRAGGGRRPDGADRRGRHRPIRHRPRPRWRRGHRSGRASPVRGRDPAHDGLGRRSGARRAGRRRRLSMAGARSRSARRAHRDRDPGDVPPDEHRDRLRAVRGPGGRRRQPSILRAILVGADPARSRVGLAGVGRWVGG